MLFDSKVQFLKQWKRALDISTIRLRFSYGDIALHLERAYVEKARFVARGSMSVDWT